MKCYICDRDDDSITIDARDGKFCPCRTCQAIIFECANTDNDRDLLEANDTLTG